VANELIDQDGLDGILNVERVLLLKHSERCGISRRAFGAYESFLAEQPDLTTGWIDVVNRRELSQTAAQRTGVEHKSPQAIWIVNGTAVWNASHFDITKDSLAEAAAITG
jgi:bacillithiol system protein YtxJ